MDMIHIAKLPDGKYMLVEAIGQQQGAASFAPTINGLTEDELRTKLSGYGFTEKAIKAAVEKVKATGNESLNLERPPERDSGTIRRPS